MKELSTFWGMLASLFAVSMLLKQFIQTIIYFCIKILKDELFISTVFMGFICGFNPNYHSSFSFQKV
jgi:hypothetical protein